MRYITDISKFKNGWFVGNFEPSVLKSEAVEVAFHEYPAGHKGDGHYHNIATEINLIIEGKVGFPSSVILSAGAIWIVKPGEISDAIFLEDTKLIVIKAPSVPGDKHYRVENTHELTPLEAFEAVSIWSKNFLKAGYENNQ